VTARRQSLATAGLARTTRMLSGVLAAQAAVQAIGALSGFLLVRWMSVESFAEYTVAFGFTTTLSNMVDLGFASAVIALVGTRVDDPEIVGGFIRAGRRIRNRLLTIGLPIGGLFFFAITDRQHWPIGTRLALYATIVASVAARGMFDYFQLPLVMHRRFGAYYGPQITLGVVRLVANVATWTAGLLTALAANIINAAVLFGNGLSFRRRVGGEIAGVRRVIPELEREMRHYVAPLIPSIAFFAVQAQFVVFVVAIFANTRSIAEVGALSRLGVLFLIPAALNGVVVSPYIARLEREGLLTGYVRVLRVALGGSFVVCAACFLVPELPLLVLGSRYSGLKTEIGWYAVASTLAYVGSVVYAMNGARRFVFYWASVGGAVLTAVVQVCAVLLFDVTTTLGNVYVVVCTNATLLGVALSATFWGFSRGPRARGHRQGDPASSSDLQSRAAPVP
jgi:O-antigen/teichoic acid export membrane protein